ncbi:MAG: gamma-glutamylcyclotransferase [Methylobacteriaceae bacterium]|nr:gamma-glutamylcyclotransferase [Methylobacteriaceae bacterium]
MSDIPTRDPGAPYAITRESLLDGRHLARARGRAHPDYPLRSDEELEASLDSMLSRHPPGTEGWVFGYGSLIWNPAFRFVERRPAVLRGYHRRFCLRLTRGRGSDEHPGLMLALDRAGMCRGVAFRIAAEELRHELLLIWRREMLFGSYQARWVEIATEAGSLRAIAFVVDRSHPRYVGSLPVSDVAERIRSGRGELGTNRAYFDETVAALSELGIRDAALERLRRLIEAGPAELSRPRRSELQ